MPFITDIAAAVAFSKSLVITRGGQDSNLSLSRQLKGALRNSRGLKNSCMILSPVHLLHNENYNMSRYIVICHKGRLVGQFVTWFYWTLCPDFVQSHCDLLPPLFFSRLNRVYKSKIYWVAAIPIIQRVGTILRFLNNIYYFKLFITRDYLYFKRK